MDVEVDIDDPWADAYKAEHEYVLLTVASPEIGAYNVAVVAVAHRFSGDGYRGHSRAVQTRAHR